MWFSFITRWAMARQLAKRRDTRFRSFEETERVVLLVQDKDLSSILPAIQELADGGKKVTLVVEAKHKNSVPATVQGCYPILVSRTYWLLNRPTKEFLQTFDHYDGDVLLDVSTTGSLPLAYLAVHSKALFKIGLPKNEKNPFQLQILMPGAASDKAEARAANSASKSTLNAGELLHNALFYWKKIGAKENNL